MKNLETDFFFMQNISPGCRSVTFNTENVFFKKRKFLDLGISLFHWGRNSGPINLKFDMELPHDM